MKCYCQYSGTSFTLPQFGGFRESIVTVHPIFHLPGKNLGKVYSLWQEGELSELDCRLLFLALLKDTGLVEWRTTARPSHETVQLHMSSLYYTWRWARGIMTPQMKLPHFAITNDTCTLENVGQWLHVWEDIKEAFDAGYRTTSDLEKQQQREEILQRLIRSPNEDEGRYAGILAQWAMEAAGVRKDVRDYWRGILTTKGISIFSIKLADIEEIVETFEDSLASHGSIYSHAILRYVRKLREQVQCGLGLASTSLDLVDIAARGEFSIVDEQDVKDTELLNVQKIIQSAPSSEPRRENYESQVAYLRAKIAWSMAARAKEAEKNREEELDAANKAAEAQAAIEQLNTDLEI